jgi:hypothetical protein
MKTEQLAQEVWLDVCIYTKGIHQVWVNQKKTAEKGIPSDAVIM